MARLRKAAKATIRIF